MTVRQPPLPGASSRSRRALLAGRSQPEPCRPPWVPAGALAAACTGCGACIASCPERILLLDPQGRPKVDFALGACTFCGACAAACPEPVFDRRSDPPWSLIAGVGAGCLAAAGIVCEVCRDNCPSAAIRFRPTLGRVATPLIERDACTGCGACVAPCPTTAITIAAAPILAEHAG